MCVIKNLWGKAKCHSFKEIGSFDDFSNHNVFETLLKNKSVCMIFDEFAVMHTNVTPEGTFYHHVVKIVALVKGHSWTINTDMTIADQMTMYLMGCRHVSTSAFVSEEFIESV